MNRTRGFTLLELTLLTAIIAVLAALLFPALATARRQARLSGCREHLKQIGTALNLYQADYGAIPDPIRLVKSLPDARFRVCPAESGERVSLSSYVFRGALPPDFRPYWEQSHLDPHTVVASCNHHLERDRAENGSPHKPGEPRYPFKPALRAGGSVQEIAIGDIRQVLVPGDRPAYVRVYPGEPGWEKGQGTAWETQ